MPKKSKIQTRRKEIRLSPEVQEKLISQAAEHNMDTSAYIRMLIMQRPADDPDVRERLDKLIYEINKIGVNVNQIAYNANIGFYSENESQRLTQYLKEIQLEVQSVIKFCRKSKRG